MYKLPGFSKSHVESFLKSNQTNPHLLFYRYLYGSSSGTSDTNNAANLREAFCFSKGKPKADSKMATYLRIRQDAFLAQWEKNFPRGVCSASFDLLGRMAVGMGISSSFENGLLMDWIHGVPFINGEAVKGAARSYASELMTACPDETICEDFRNVFGTIKKEEESAADVFAGKVIFFDAFPETNYDLFDVDIITTHYGPYYTGNDPEPPGDWHSPNPVAFLSVKEGVSFRFNVASQLESLTQKAMEWLKGALIQRGMGAKKRVGYGHFAENISKAIQPSSITAQGSSSFNSLMMKIQTIQASKIPESASDIVKSIETLPNPDEVKNAAKAFWKRLSADFLKKNRNKEWLNTLKKLTGEGL